MGISFPSTILDSTTVWGGDNKKVLFIWYGYYFAIHHHEFHYSGGSVEGDPPSVAEADGGRLHNVEWKTNTHTQSKPLCELADLEALTGCWQ